MRDVYSGNKNIWQNSLRGASRSEGENTRGRSRQTRANLEPVGGRSVLNYSTLNTQHWILNTEQYRSKLIFRLFLGLAASQ